LAGETKLGTTTPNGNPELVKENQDRYCLIDSMIFCSFSRYGLNDALRQQFLEIVTGRPIDPPIVAERIFTLERLFNIREGFDPVSASQSSNGIPVYGDAFYFVKLFSEMSVIEVGILVKGELDYPLGKLMVKCFG